jgi:hypothetical protein
MSRRSLAVAAALALAASVRPAGAKTLDVEEAFTNRVLGALMDSKGRVRCTVDGAAFDDGCFDLVICGWFEPICL